MAPQNCPQVSQGCCHEQMCKCKVISYEALSYKIKLPFLISLHPFFKLCSPPSFLERGQKPKEKPVAAARVTTYFLPRARSPWGEVGTAALREMWSSPARARILPLSPRFGCSLLGFFIIEHIFYITSIVYVCATASSCFVCVMLWMYIIWKNEYDGRSFPWGALHHR